MINVKHIYFVFFGGILACIGIFATPDVQLLFTFGSGILAGMGLEFNLDYFKNK